MATELSKLKGIANDYEHSYSREVNRIGEVDFIQSYDLSRYQNPEHPVLTADILLFAPNSEGELSVLLVERGNHPYKGYYALPGGFVEKGEDPMAAAVRELNEETGLSSELELKLVGFYDEPWRDPRGEKFRTFAYLATLDRAADVRGLDDAKDAVWVSVDWILKTRTLAFDHLRILCDGLRVL